MGKNKQETEKAFCLFKKTKFFSSKNIIFPDSVKQYTVCLFSVLARSLVLENKLFVKTENKQNILVL